MYLLGMDIRRVITLEHLASAIAAFRDVGRWEVNLYCEG